MSREKEYKYTKIDFVKAKKILNDDILLDPVQHSKNLSDKFNEMGVNVSIFINNRLRT